ncbi:MAG: 23S rRNA (pseudouridine(1915)-N(3))-methyltransferase RlmH [Trichlorobacter sp.]|jgi:23S rRNA (pseudouridine1915-N3)-methyltransferase|nr:23S rRNA (pseudouridine(1915)-N(3))-methyltransferase RlmH [Trichlorobacter sp.]
MKCRVIWLGKSREQWVKTAIDEYAGRIKHYLPFFLNELKEEKDAQSAAGRHREGERLLKQLLPQAILVVLDEKGRQMNSEAFATFIGRHRDEGTTEMVFAIGGAYGFSDEVRKRADFTLSLSAMTFTHQMVRPFLLEQIYRACTILNREPYHH